jgi:hypothetical protein
VSLRKIVTLRAALSDPDYFGDLLAGETWASWRALLIAIVGEEMTEDERVIFEGLTGRINGPAEPVEEFWGIIGRRGGKTRSMAVLGAYLAACCDHRARLAPGQRGQLPIIAASVDQAAEAFNYLSGIFAESPSLHPLVERETSDTLSLSSGIDIRVRPASYRTIRGITAVGAICDEIAQWRSEDSANPDREILRALRPSLGTTSGPLICISSPRAKLGELYNTFSRHWGADGHSSILVAKAPSRVMNPSLPQRVVDRAFEEDPESARAEYEAEFRGDLEIFVSREAIEACVERGLTVRPPQHGVRYFAFVDPSGGSSDSMTMAIAHRERERVVLDCLLERRAPFSPDDATAEFAGTAKVYGCSTVTGDQYAKAWPVERFAAHGVTYLPAGMNKSELYLAFLPLVNSGRVDLLDNPRLISQFFQLERRVSRGGRDTVDHPRDAKDDVANACAGAAALLSGVRQAPNWNRIADAFSGRQQPVQSRWSSLADQLSEPIKQSPWDADRPTLEVTLSPKGMS